MATTYGMRGEEGERIRLTQTGVDLLQQGRLNMMMLQGVQQAAQSGDRSLLFVTKMYRCAHCGTRYESLPSLQGAVRCRNCGSNEVGEA
jgi:predicted Zn-ribbon and HTH transcriptional regulator